MESTSPGLLKNGKILLCTSSGSRENNQNKVRTQLWDTLYVHGSDQFQCWCGPALLRWPANVMFAQGQHQILSCCQAQGQRLKGCQRNVTVILQNSVKAPLKVPFGESFA